MLQGWVRNVTTVLIEISLLLMLFWKMIPVLRASCRVNVIGVDQRQSRVTLWCALLCHPLLLPRTSEDVVSGSFFWVTVRGSCAIDPYQHFGVDKKVSRKVMLI